MWLKWDIEGFGGLELEKGFALDLLETLLNGGFREETELIDDLSFAEFVRFGDTNVFHFDHFIFKSLEIELQQEVAVLLGRGLLG